MGPKNLKKPRANSAKEVNEVVDPPYKMLKRDGSDGDGSDGDERKQSCGEYFHTRMSPKGLYKLVHGLNDNQKAAVRKIGFGGLLDLQMNGVNGKLAMFLLEHFNVAECSIEVGKKSLALSEEDVFYALGLPCGGKEVVEAKGIETSKEYEKVLEDWRKRWNVKAGSPRTPSMPSKILKDKDHGENFIRDFVVYVVSSFLFGHKNEKSRYKILYSLVDVNEIHKLDWCHYTIKSLVESVHIWKRSAGSYFHGPIVFLMICYLERFQFKFKEKRVIHFPAISNWSTGNVNERVKRELEDNGSLGGGRVVDWQTVTEDDHDQEKPLSIELPKKSSTRLVKALENLGSSLAEFREAHEECAEELVKCEKFKATMKGLSEYFNDVSSSQEEGPVDASTSGQRAKIPILDDPYFSDPVVLEALEKVEEIYKKAPKEAKKDDTRDSSPSKRKTKDDRGTSTLKRYSTLTHRPSIGDTPSFSLGLSFTPEMPTIPRHCADDSHRLLNATPKTPTSSKDCGHLRPLRDHYDDDQLLDDPIGRSGEIQVRKRPRRRVHILPIILRSPYWVKVGRKQLWDVSAHEGLITEYAFRNYTDEHPKDEVLFKYFELVLTREHIRTLSIHEWIVGDVIDVWCLLLNHHNLRRAVGDPNRVFFSTLPYRLLRPSTVKEGHSLFGHCYDVFCKRLDAELELYNLSDLKLVDLVFFVVFENSHYYVVCINFKKSRIEVLDNRTLPPRAKYVNKYQNFVRSLANAFGSYINQRKLRKCEDVNAFEEKLLMMPWRNNTNHVDCGIFSMRHMETYKGQGDKWESGLFKDNEAPLLSLRAKYCASILCHDLNQVGDGVVKRARNMLKEERNRQK